MSWRKDLVTLDISLEGKREIIRKKREKRNYFLDLGFWISLIVSFLTDLALIFFKVFSRSFKGIAISVFLWITWIFLTYVFVKGIEFFLLRKDKKTLSTILFCEDLKKICQKK